MCVYKCTYDVLWLESAVAYPVNSEFDAVADFECALDVADVKHEASTHLYILHRELHLLSCMSTQWFKYLQTTND